MTPGLPACPLPERVDPPRILGLLTWGLSWFWPLLPYSRHTHISHGTILAFLSPPCMPDSHICPMRNLSPGWVGDLPRVAEQVTARVPMPRLGKLLPGTLAAEGSTLGQGGGAWVFIVALLPASLASPPPCLSLFSLQQKTPGCAQPAHHYPPNRAIPARLGCGGHVLRGSLCTFGAGASVVWAPLPLLALPSPCRDQAP